MRTKHVREQMCPFRELGGTMYITRIFYIYTLFKYYIRVVYVFPLPYSLCMFEFGIGITLFANGHFPYANGVAPFANRKNPVRVWAGPVCKQQECCLRTVYRSQNGALRFVTGCCCSRTSFFRVWSVTYIYIHCLHLI